MGNKGSKSKKSKKEDKKSKDAKSKDEAKVAEKSIPQVVEEEKKEDAFTQRITCYVIQARNLPKYDMNGKSDPYVKVQFSGIDNASYRTTYIRKELNPIWNASFVEEAPGLFGQVKEITFEVYDRDRVSKDDLMGKCVLPVMADPQGFYSSPVQWVKLQKDGNLVKGGNDEDAALQIGIMYAPKVEDLNIRHWTHVMELTVVKGNDIKSTDFLSRSDPYVQLEFGSQRYHTKTLNNTKEPVWNETAFLFVHTEMNAKTQMKLTVMDKDLTADDLLGTGYVSAPDLFNAPEGKVTVHLRQVQVSSDKALQNVDDQGKVWGDVELEIKMVPAEEVEKGFYSALIKSFDQNNDGVIDKEELKEIYTELQVSENMDDLLAKFDEDNDEKLDETEVMKMLQDADFQGSELATQLIAMHLEGRMNDNHRVHLMQGFSQKQHASRKTLKIRDRGTGLIVQEHIPKYVDWALKLVYDYKLNRKIVQSKFAHGVLAKGSKAEGDAMDKPESKAKIPGFIKQHNLDVSELYKPVEEFKTFNDFFARGMKVDECRPLADPEDESVVVSPADCRMMVWDTILDATKVWIKGSRFTLENLLGPDSKVDLKKYEGGSFAIARLAPQDYHRWHYPIGGKVVNIEHIDGALYTVNPIAINKTVDVYTENKRAIIEIDGGKNGGCIMFAIAATMVGSYTLFKEEAADPTKDEPVPLQLGDEVKRGGVAGEFRFGGSTVLMLFEPNKVKWSDDIRRNVAVKFETLLNVRERIGQIQS